MTRRALLAAAVLTGVLVGVGGSAHAQAPIASDDAYAVSAGGTLVVDPIGVLENDTDATGEDLPPTAWARLVGDVGAGTLELAPDGSFTYTPAGGFLGVDGFEYEVVDGAATSNVATVTLDVQGCEGALPLRVCWLEAEFVAELLALGHETYREGFEEGAVWPLSPEGAASVTSLGITWAPSEPGAELVTGSGAAHTGARGVFSIPHGHTSGGALDPQRDGFTGTSAGTLVGVGGWLDSNTGGARVQLVLSSPPEAPRVVDFPDPALAGAPRFFGVIDTRGFSTFQVVETEGVVEDQQYVFADDFTFAVEGAPACGNGVDDDADGLADFPLDPGCLAAADVLESPQCQDGTDDDGDGAIDFDGGQSIHGACAGGACPAGVSDPDGDGVADPDPQCVGRPWRNRERARACGLGFEIAGLLAPVAWLAGGRRRAGRCGAPPPHPGPRDR